MKYKNLAQLHDAWRRKPAIIDDLPEDELVEWLERALYVISEVRRIETRLDEAEAEIVYTQEAVAEAIGYMKAEG